MQVDIDIPVRWIEKDHAEDCFAVTAVERGDWSTPWFMDGTHEYRDVLGRKNPNGRWWARVICNDPRCRAQFFIPWEALEAVVAAAAKFALNPTSMRNVTVLVNGKFVSNEEVPFDWAPGDIFEYASALPHVEGRVRGQKAHFVATSSLINIIVAT